MKRGKRIKLDGERNTGTRYLTRLLSLERRPYHRRRDASRGTDGFESLLTSEWPTVGRENGPPSYRDAIDVSNRKVRSYLELSARLPTTLMTYERLVIDPAKVLDEIRQASSNEWRRGRFENLPESTKKKGKDSAFYSDYYGKELWREKLTSEQIEVVSSRLDRELVGQLGYGIL